MPRYAFPDTSPVERTLELVSGLLYDHMTTHYRSLGHFHNLLLKWSWNHDLPHGFATVHIRVFVNVVQHSTLNFNGDFSLIFSHSVFLVPVVFQTFTFTLHLDKLSFVPSGTFRDIGFFRRGILPFVPCLTSSSCYNIYYQMIKS